MKYTAVVFLGISCVWTLQAQDAGALVKDLQQSYMGIKGNLMAAAEAMPESDYDFKLTPAQRTFGGWVAHVAEAQTRTCGGIAGSSTKSDAGSKTSKADLVAALAESFKECDAAWDSLTEANAGDKVGQRSRMGTLLVDVIHSNEEYGYMAIYFRLKGIVPPSSDRAGRK